MIKNNYLVTGSAGFIGSHISKKLISLGHNVWTIDDFSTGNKKNLPKKIKLISGKCENQNIFKKIKKIKFSAIIHIAGQSSGEISFNNPINDLKKNTQSVLNLLNFLIKNNCNRFIYASSMSVYGSTLDKPIKENNPCNPLSFYGISKLASENYIKLFSNYGINWTVLRLFNVYGPNQNLTNMKQGMVSIYLSQLINNSVIQVKGSINRYRDFIYIDDVTEIFIKSINQKESFNKIINVGTGKKTTVKELLQKINKKTQKKYITKITENTPGDQKGIYANNSNLKKIFNKKKFISIDQGLLKMVHWINIKFKINL
tara:strand:- start:459 stop:1403 length:945 start_codon:yes stop_codon:yes gene_type:complete